MKLQEFPPMKHVHLSEINEALSDDKKWSSISQQ